MTRVTGIGGVFLKAQDPARLSAWYGRHLGLPMTDWGGTDFEWREKDAPEKVGKTVWALFPADTTYFGSGGQQTMINFRIEDMDGLLQKLAAEGIEIDPHREEQPYGRFAWIVDPEGNRIELWEPRALEECPQLLRVPLLEMSFREKTVYSAHVISIPGPQIGIQPIGEGN